MVTLWKWSERTRAERSPAILPPMTMARPWLRGLESMLRSYDGDCRLPLGEPLITDPKKLCWRARKAEAAPRAERGAIALAAASKRRGVRGPRWRLGRGSSDLASARYCRRGPRRFFR